MTMFEQVFNPSTIYDSLFLSVKTVLEYPSLEELKNKNKGLYQRWKYISKKYEKEYIFEKKNNNMTVTLTPIELDDIYRKYGVKYSEFLKIVSISYATLYIDENGKINRELNPIAFNDEELIIDSFFDSLNEISNAYNKADKKLYLCGHNIYNFDIPILIKKFIKYNFEIRNKKLPKILKEYLNSKPWESNIIDTINIWKFVGGENTSLMLISDFLGLKRNENDELLDRETLSNYYWDNIKFKEEETLRFISKQSALQISFVMQLMRNLRDF